MEDGRRAELGGHGLDAALTYLNAGMTSLVRMRRLFFTWTSLNPLSAFNSARGGLELWV